MNYESVMKLALERAFYFPSCEVYGDAQAGFWEYGPTGVSVKNKFLELWRRELVRRDRMLEIDGSQIMSKSVFEASGHLGNFADPIIKCKKCGLTFRADKLIAEISNVEIPESADLEDFDKMIQEKNIVCTKCKGEFDSAKKFNMMFRVGIGPEDEEAYLRPETCQSIFVDFPRLFKTMRGKLPLGIAQVGKSFRNEIAPRQSLLRLREFYQAEIEVFCNPGKLNELEKFSEIKRIRYTTSHPRDMTDDLINCYSSCKKLMPFVHLPIQSGSDKILHLMNRKHKVDDYLKVYEKLININNEIKFSSDFIIGYPGETENDFNDTLKLLDKVNFINSFSFIFSPRPGTTASNYELIDNEICKERLITIQKKLFNNQIQINKSMEKQSVEVLVENKLKNQNKYFGRNKYLSSVIFDGSEDIIGKLVEVKIENSNQNSLFGKLDNKMAAA